MRLRIIQLATPNIDSYAKYSVGSILQLSRFNHYSYVLYRSSLNTDEHINWTKILAINKEVDVNPQTADLFVFVDADSLFIHPEFDLIEFLKPYLDEDTHILMPQDDPTAFWKKNRPNAGFIVVKNSETGRLIIDRWIEAAFGIGKKFKDIHPRNQLVYWNFVMPDFLRNQKLLPLKYFKKGRKESFLNHFMKRKDGFREKMMREIYQKNCSSDILIETEELLKKNLDGKIELSIY